jgi:hypothetical protein
VTFERRARSTDMTRTQLLPLALVAVALAATPVATASAAIKNPQAGAAMRKGIRDVARIEADGATASRIKVTCPPVKQVNQQRSCTGTFRLTKDGRSADYTLVAGNHVLRISKGAIEYRVTSQVVRQVQGLPQKTDLMGFLQ